MAGGKKVPSTSGQCGEVSEAGGSVCSAAVDGPRFGQRDGKPRANGEPAPGARAAQRPVLRRSPAAASLGPARPARVLGYASTNVERAEHRQESLRRQVEAIALECERRGLILLRVVHEREPRQKRPLDRPGLSYALGRITTGEVDGLVVSEFARIAHSVPELGGVLECLAGHGARIVVAAASIDTDEGAGRVTAQAIIQISRSERERMTERTRNGMRAARRNGLASVSDYPELRERIATMRAGGMTLQGIANQLNAEGIPTVRGGVKWRPSSVQAAAGYLRKAARQATELRGSHA